MAQEMDTNLLDLWLNADRLPTPIVRSLIEELNERRHSIESRENGLQREHDTGELAAGCDASQSARLVSDVQRDLELDGFGAGGPKLLERSQRDGDVAVGHPELR